jgi:hypothetical protein
MLKSPAKMDSAMKAGGRLACLSICVLLVGLMLPSSPVQSDRGIAQPDSIFQVDVPTWHVGDTWTYSTHIHLRMGENYTDLYGSVNFLVTGLFSVRQNGTYHEAYNVSLSGAFTGNGGGVLNGIQFSITISSGSLTGFHWYDRADLSLIRDNETVDASGTVNVLFFQYPLTLRFATESNRSPSQEDYDFPLLPGDQWRLAGNMRMLGFYFFSVTGTPWGDISSTSPFDHNMTMDYDGRLSGVEDLNFGGTNYRTYHVSETPTSGSGNVGGSDLWYAPALKSFARWYITASNIDFVLGGFLNLTSHSFIQPPYQTTMNLDPQIVNPGGFLNVTGDMGLWGTATIWTPWNESTWTRSSNATGDYSFMIRAPTRDDYTPCNADVGSFGVLIETFDLGGRISRNASTIVLLLPDLSISQSDLSFSSPLQVGVPTTIRAVVHTSSDVGVYNFVEVNFLLDGSFLTADSFGPMLPGSQHTFTGTWIPTAGIHTIAARVDPRDLIRERDESNNYAEIGAATSLPDLVPWNITISDGEFVHYDDPATVGFATSLLNASWGETLAVAFGIRNAGNDTFGGQVRIVIVQTRGLRGPAIAPPFYDQMLSVTMPSGTFVDAPPATWPVPQTHTSHFFNLTIDPDNLIPETFEGNNTFAIRISVGAPDLTIGVTGPSKIPLGGTGSATVNVRNAGDKLSPATSVEVRNATSGSLLGSIPVSPMNPGAIGSLNYPLDALTSATGSVCLQFDIDAADSILESNESNNGFEWCFDVTPFPETSMELDGAVYVGVTYTYITNATNIDLISHDNSGTGIARTQYSIDGGAWVDYSVGTPTHMDSEGLHQIRFNSTDNIGGAEATVTRTLFVDDIAPVSTAAWNGTAVLISATDAGCGVNATFYRLDSGTLVLYDGPFAVTGDGQHTVWFYSVDRLGNVEEQGSLLFTIGGASAAVEVNLKLQIAIVFAADLLAVFLFLRREDKRRNLFIVAILFIVAELATGAASLAVDALSYVPLTGKMLGIYIDLVVLVVGMAVLWMMQKSAEPAGAPEESGEGLPEEKA